MDFATISADVISYTSLTGVERRTLESGIKHLFSVLAERYKNQSFYGRLVQGDYMECAIDTPQYALRIALILKTYIKSIVFDVSKNNKSRQIGRAHV